MKLFVEGQWETGDATLEVRSPWDGRGVGSFEQASAAQIERALKAAVNARPRLAAQSSGKRREVLEGIAHGLKAREQAFIDSICDEAGKPLSTAKVEVARAIETFKGAAAELSRWGGEIVPVDFLPNQANTEAEVRRFPAGVIVGIVPFNFPLNLGAHKVAPALAVGAPIVIKPPHQCPGAQLLLAEVAQAAGADPAALQVLPCSHERAEAMATDPRVRVLSFTGSTAVGWKLKAKAHGKVVLELGGNAAAIVADDAELERAVSSLVPSAFSAAGQVCIKTQRILVDASVWDTFVPKFVAAATAVKTGNPREPDTVVGPVIDDKSAARIEAWVDEAIAGGARVLLRGVRKERLIPPIVLEQVPHDSKCWREEVFGPVAVLEKAKDFDHALQLTNGGDYGLQAGVFTQSHARVRRAFHALDVGGVIVNDAPSFRNDLMPYGGNKGSGLGREGVRYAMEDFSEPRVLVTRP